MTNEEKTMKKTERKLARENRKQMREMKKQEKAAKVAKTAEPREKGKRMQQVRRMIGENRTAVKRFAVAAVALVLAANVVMTCVFVAYSVRTRRQSENNYYSNCWEIDDLRTQMEFDADAITSDLDAWKTGESIFSGTIGDNLTWEIDPETAELTIHGAGEMDSTFDENRRPAFGMLYSDYVRSVVLDDSVRSIAPYAFKDFTALDSVKLGAKTAVIGENAFSGCRVLIDVTTSNGLKTIERDAFYGCDSLRSLRLPKGFESYETANSKSTNIFFTVAKGGAYSSDSFGCLYKDDGKTLVSCPVGASYNYNGDPENWGVPNGVTKIEHECFIDGEIKKLTIPGSVKSLDLAAFDNWTVRELSLQNGVKELVGTPGANVNFSKIVLPKSIERVDEELFDSDVFDIELSGKSKAFWADSNGLIYSADKKELVFVPRACEIATLRVAEGTERIRDNATDGMCSLTMVSLPDSLTVIGDNNFNSICLEKGVTFKLPAHLTYIGDNCLQFGRISKITVPSSVRSIGDNFLRETSDNWYDEDTDTFTENLTKVEYEGSQEEWEDLFFDSPDNVKVIFAD